MDDIFSNLTVITIILIFVSYLLCSIPFGLLITKLYGVKDIRKIGSGNIGATNVLRTGRKGLALITLILDFLKGFLSISITLYLNKILTENNVVIDNLDNFVIPITAIFSVIGHCYPVWLKFKGGKGVATGFGILAGFDFFIFLIIVFIWLFTFVAFRLSSLSALIAFCVSPLVFLYLNTEVCFIYGALSITIIIIIRHKENIFRLLKKEELKFKK